MKIREQHNVSGPLRADIENNESAEECRSSPSVKQSSTTTFLVAGEIK